MTDEQARPRQARPRDPARDAEGHLGAGLGLDADGHLLGDDPRLLPIYLVTVLGASTLTVGIIEGIAEATASIVKVFSGALSDWLGKRKLLAALGYGLAAFTKPVFPLAPTVGWLVAARFIDRIGKGIRGAPRDALVADLAPADCAARASACAIARYGRRVRRPAARHRPDVVTARQLHAPCSGSRSSPPSSSWL